MKRRLLFASTIGAMMFAVSAGADVKSLLDPATGSEKQAIAYGGAPSAAHSYRSPTSVRKILVSSNDPSALAEARALGAVELADYETFKLLSLDHEATMVMSSMRLNTSGAIVRDDFNLVLLRSGAIDTTGDSEGTFFGLGRDLEGRARVPRKGTVKGREGDHAPLRLIQFVGPMKREWIEELEANGLEPIAYVPNNAYLVRGDGSAGAVIERVALNSQAQNRQFIQWEAPYLPDFKVHPRLLKDAVEKPRLTIPVGVQLAPEGPWSLAVRADLDSVIERSRRVLVEPYDVAGFTTMRVSLPAARVLELARLDHVVNIEPWVEPRLLDERANQIVAGSLSDDMKRPTGPGYLAWLQARGFGAPFGFAIDVVDSGIDRGSTSTDRLHPDFLDASGQTRVVYASDFTSEKDASDQSGHGTINLSIAGGASSSGSSNMRDSQGYNHGLGIAPFALLGSSRIFQSSGRFGLGEPFSNLVIHGYKNGARISSNSWGATTNSYTIEAQEYDARVRDALPLEPGNQGISIFFAAGNAGPGGLIASPGSGKNVISVGASENWRMSGTDGCGVLDEDADSAMDIAYFSAGGNVLDGRVKPDIVAPGTHIQGAASQHPDFDGFGVCGLNLGEPFFPANQKLYTWSSGTSHSTPILAGAGALVRQHFLDRGHDASPALVKAVLLNSTTYMTGQSAGGDLPHERQGWGLLNLGRAFDDTSRIFIDQTHRFTNSGAEFILTGEIVDTTRPFRVTLVWTDAPGFSAFAPWVNDLDLEVIINGKSFTGNNFSQSESQPGGEPDTMNNVEAVWLPAGVSGPFLVRVRASNLAGDGVPGNADPLDQDFALVVYNAESKGLPVPLLSGVQLEGDLIPGPGRSVSVSVEVRNASNIAMSGARGVLTSTTAGISLTSASADFPNVAPGQSSSPARFEFEIAADVACGTAIELALELTAQGATSRLPFSLVIGEVHPLELLADDIESGEGGWTHGSLIKKKKKRIDTWIISRGRSRSGEHAWFTPNLGVQTDSNLDINPVLLPDDGRDLELVFHHTFEFEPFGFDGGVLEISVNGDKFVDLGEKIRVGRYNGAILEFSNNPIKGRNAWVDGRLGEFRRVVVDLNEFAGKTVVIRFRIGTDTSVKGLGWYVDDVTIAGKRVTCSP